MESWCCLQVEASTSKGVIRIAGTAAGGILAYAVMLRPALATRSVPLAAILLAVTFLAGCIGHTQFKVTLRLKPYTGVLPVWSLECRVAAGASQ